MKKFQQYFLTKKYPQNILKISIIPVKIINKKLTIRIKIL